MDLDSLRLFVLAAETLNISAAGRTLGMAPAVASTRLAKLERSLGVELLHRSTRKVSLSADGAEFLPYAAEILAQESAARSALGLQRADAAGTLRFAAPSTFAQLYIAPLLPEFLQRYPRLDLDLRLSDTPFDLIEGSFDLALRNAALEDSSLKARKLADDRRILCAAPAYLDRRGVPQTPEDLAAHDRIGFRDRAAKSLVGPDGAATQIDFGGPGCRLVVDDGANLKAATHAGAGISINSLWSVHREIADGTLVRVLPDHDVDDRTALWLVYPQSNVLTAKVRLFIDFLLEQIGKPPVWERA
ncbi:MAG: LysR family transcriptional regulator [Rhodospirillaceae bacterium]|nr:LysR family transcriptional regulator [Rhodospirillaceae bacterium]MDD9914447.1 LysR family transcriptional regulator [Rhodospirillaceae bacterium]MDD9928558.1 LysR family transcriptional regulator [Rhodospirillaceae bacterium]